MLNKLVNNAVHSHKIIESTYILGQFGLLRFDVIPSLNESAPQFHPNSQISIGRPPETFICRRMKLVVVVRTTPNRRIWCIMNCSNASGSVAATFRTKSKSPVIEAHSRTCSFSATNF